MKSGEVYWDNTFNWEVTIVEVHDEHLVLDDQVEDGYRDYPILYWTHNESVGRFEYLRDGEDVENEEVAENANTDEIEEAENQPKGILDY